MNHQAETLNGVRIQTFAHGILFRPCRRADCASPGKAQRRARRALLKRLKAKGFKPLRGTGEYAVYYLPRPHNVNRWGAFFKCNARKII